MRIFAAPIMAIIFLGWVFYIAFITKTIKKHKNEVFAGFFFMAIWAVIIGLIFI
ncbi:hypothetical protein [Mucilaginibacter glaciei]|uniref:Uncharacterized protein n=1 Tax=Mucilaginibacter glaciei TaxID=2772109 RepID=A0A926NZJ0_9SPHI|nr:hypothetical protein [Mucilaginibacter glaciei]MBD1394813.1 hypothetical protein [Mucilaginibacter glaciei]